LNNKSVLFEQIAHKFLNFIDSCGRLNYYTRSKRLQGEKIKECDEFIQEIKIYKAQAVKKCIEADANEFFLMQCVVNALRSSLSMWINLKNESYQKSWSCLIDAQDYVCVGLKVRKYEGLLNIQKHLKSIERAVFPGWVKYNSLGFVETVGNCSICGKKFIECDHIENQIYLGSLCQRVDRKIIELNHSALVENPRDRRCTINKISDDDGNMIDYYTWEKTGENKKYNEDEVGHMECALLTMSSLDVT